MVARSATEAAFAPADRPRVAIASDGTLAAVQEAARVVVVEVPGCALFTEVGVDPEAGATEVAWVGAPPRLVVLSRYAAHSTVHLLDPRGPRTLAEIRLEAPMRLFASVGAHALAVGAIGAAVLTATETHLTPYQFPARSAPVAAGAAGNQFVVGVAGAIEEWDPHSRMPKRRLKLPRPAVITAVGGSERVVWMTTQQDPTRIDVMPLVNRGQPKLHELPEPIAHVAAHPRSDLVVCVGADTGRLYVIDLDGRAPQRVIAADGIDRVEAAGLVLGRTVGVLAAQARRPVTLVLLDNRDAAPEFAAAPPSPPVDREPEPPPKPSTLFGERVILLSPQVPEAPAATVEPPPARPQSLFRQPTSTPTAATKIATTSQVAPGPSLAERFSTWRDRMRSAQPRSAPAPLSPIDSRPSWRDEVTTWAAAVVAGSVERGAPAAPLIDEIVARFELPPALEPAVVLLYGAHLAGQAGAAPADVARVLGRRWDEALGRGLLAERGVATFRESRVRLAPVVQRALDELPPRTGTIVGVPGSIALLGPCVVVAPDGPLGVIAEQCLPSVGGAIFAGHPHADPHELFLEARAYGALPMVRVSTLAIDRIPIGAPALLVADEAIADQLGIPRLT